MILLFLTQVKYKNDATKTKAGACITTEKLVNFLPKKVEKVIVKNVLFELAKILKVMYSFSRCRLSRFRH